jgi:hypothetical protein
MAQMFKGAQRSITSSVNALVPQPTSSQLSPFALGIVDDKLFATSDATATAFCARRTMQQLIRFYGDDGDYWHPCRDSLVPRFRSSWLHRRTSCTNFGSKGH